MAITLSVPMIKERLGIGTTDFDTQILNLMTDWVTYLNYAVDPRYIDDVGNGYLQVSLKLAALDIVCGEAYLMLLRAPGAMDRVIVGDVELEPPSPAALKALDPRPGAWGRLKPFLKKDISLAISDVASIGGKPTIGEDA